MKCANHPTLDAVGICNGCGRGVCPDCQIGLDQVLCAACLTAHNKQVMVRFTKQLAMSVVLLVGSLIFLRNSALGWQQVIIYSLMVTFLPFGWTTLSRIFSPDGGYFNAGTRWVSLLVHLAVAAMLGWLVGPWQIYKAIVEIRKARAANTSVATQ